MISDCLHPVTRVWSELGRMIVIYQPHLIHEASDPNLHNQTVINAALLTE